MGYKFQFVTLAGFHALNLSMFELAHGYQDSGMTAYSRLQEQEFARKRDTDTRPSSTSASWERDTSTRSRRSCRRRGFDYGAGRFYRAGTVCRTHAAGRVALTFRRLSAKIDKRTTVSPEALRV